MDALMVCLVLRVVPLLSGNLPPPRARSLGAVEVLPLAFGVAKIESDAFTSYVVFTYVQVPSK